MTLAQLWFGQKTPNRIRAKIVSSQPIEVNVSPLTQVYDLPLFGDENCTTLNNKLHMAGASVLCRNLKAYSPYPPRDALLVASNHLQDSLICSLILIQSA